MPKVAIAKSDDKRPRLAPRKPTPDEVNREVRKPLPWPVSPPIASNPQAEAIHLSPNKSPVPPKTHTRKLSGNLRMVKSPALPPSERVHTLPESLIRGNSLLLVFSRCQKGRFPSSFPKNSLGSIDRHRSRDGGEIVYYKELLLNSNPMHSGI